MKRVAICGGSGELGSWVATKLVATGRYWCQVYDRKYPADMQKPPAQQYNIFDLVNAPGYYDNFRWNEFEICFQLAVPAFDARLSTALIESLKVNMHVLEACAHAGVKEVVTVVDPERDTSAIIERLFMAYKHDLGLKTTVRWARQRNEATAEMLVKPFLALDRERAAG